MIFYYIKLLHNFIFCKFFFLTFIKKLSYDVFVAKSVLFKRYYHNDTFIEVLVLNPYANEGNTYCLGVDSYYAYYGNYRVGEGATPPIDGFTAENYPYMTDEKLYLAQRPETIIPLLNHTTTFTDASRWWSFLAFP